MDKSLNETVFAFIVAKALMVGGKMESRVIFPVSFQILQYYQRSVLA
jgi:hypothetical protein